MAPKVQVHVVSKTDCSDAHIVSTDVSLLPPLAPNNIRLQVRMCSLTSNNLTYARLGSVANWWDGELLKASPINIGLPILTTSSFPSPQLPPKPLRRLGHLRHRPRLGLRRDPHLSNARPRTRANPLRLLAFFYPPHRPPARTHGTGRPLHRYDSAP